VENTDFCTARDNYEERREEERKELANYLSKNEKIANAGLKVKTRGRAGKGWTAYKSGGKIAPYDLSNWKWVELNHTDNRFDCVISLNMPEVDLSSGNTHCLYDRIGIYITYPRDGCYYKTDIYTDIDLPLDKEAKDRIVELIVEQFGYSSAAK